MTLDVTVHPATAEVVCVGDELLSGRVRDLNAAWLGARLAEHGVPVRRTTVVPDDLDLIVGAIADAAARAELVVVTGGLGGTSDDVTRAALARLSGGRVVRDAELERGLVERYAARSAVPPAGALAMADVVTGADVLPNPDGVAPGIRLRLGDAVVVALPGVPAEVQAIAEASVLPLLDFTRRRTHSLWLPQVDEAAVGDALAPLEAELRVARVRVGYLAVDGVIEVRFTAGAPDDASVTALLEPATARARELLHAALPGALVLDEPPARAVVGALTVRAATLAVAESLTGGAVAAALVDVPGASAVLRGSVVAYATDLKARLLGVPEPLLDAHGAVHPDVALAMALGVRERLQADWGLATTGVAGPTPQDGRPVGEVHVAVAGPGAEAVRSLAIRGDRERVRRGTLLGALVLLLEQLR